MPLRDAQPKRDRLSYRLFLGVDGGGTETNIALMNHEREVIAESVGGPSNPLRVGVEPAVANIAKAIDKACDVGGVLRGDIFAATLGLAGVGRQDLRERIRESFVSRLRIRNTIVMTDADIALYGTTFGKAGLVVIAGTGSVCLGVNDAGERFVAGGWGPVAGDEGGGRGIAGEALHAVAKASDGRGEPTKLSERAAEYFRASDSQNLISAINAPQIDTSRIAGFARLVVDTAKDGDKIAIEILRGAGRELGVAAVAVLKQLGLTKSKMPIGCVGGIFNAGDLVTASMKEIIGKAAPLARLAKPKMPPSHAAARLAIQDSLK